MIGVQVAVYATGAAVGAITGLIASQQALWWVLHLRAKRNPPHPKG